MGRPATITEKARFIVEFDVERPATMSKTIADEHARIAIQIAIGNDDLAVGAGIGIHHRTTDNFVSVEGERSGT